MLGASALACTGGAGLFDTGATGPGFGGGMGAEIDPADPNDPERRRGRRGGKRPPRGGPEDPDQPDRDRPPGEGEPEPAPEPSPGPPGDDKPDARGIEYLGDNHWRVQRNQLNSWTDNPSELGAGVEKRNRGYEVVGVRQGSDAAALGAQNGDIVESVNGFDLTSQMDLIQLWGKVKSEDNYRVKLIRDGKSVTQFYEVAR
ncbi:MAG: PDZ domain-containing protein [Myxococcota bacterium]